MSSPFDAQYNDLRNKIYSYADKYNIDRNIAVWQLWQESSFRTDAKSYAGAKGIAQFMPATAARFNVDPLDVDSSLDGWGKYMIFLLNRYDGNYSLALAGYNGGEGNVDKYGGIPPFAQTQNYVTTINANVAKTIGNIPTDGENPTDGTAPTAGIGAGGVLIFGLLLWIIWE